MYNVQFLLSNYYRLEYNSISQVFQCIILISLNGNEITIIKKNIWQLQSSCQTDITNKMVSMHEAGSLISDHQI